jgi:outer membrane usher protein
MSAPDRLCFKAGLGWLLVVAMPAFADDYALDLYAVSVNGQEMGTELVLHSKSGGYFGTAEDFENWGLKQANLAPFRYKDAQYYPLNGMQGFKARFDEGNQALALEFDPLAFRPTLIATPLDNVIASPAQNGAYDNYDLYGTSSNSPFLNQTQLNGQFEAGVFNRLGTGFSSFSGQNLYFNSSQTSSASSLTRLETNWTRDFPEDRQSLRFGDSTGRSGVWGRPVMFGGVQFGTNFATQPGFVTIPLPKFAGAASLPSTTEVFVNGIKQSSQAITPGPFQINNMPFITGAGEVQMVVRDMLGREQLITQSFYATPALLRPGVEDYTLELGFLRNNFAIDNASYGQPMAVATQRKGMSDKLTTEWRAEIMPAQQTAGIAATYIPPIPVALTLATALSNSALGQGHFLLLGADHQAFKGFNFGLRSQFSSNRFTQLGALSLGSTRQYSATMGLPTRMGSFGVSYNYLKNGNLLRNEFLTISYSRTFAKKISVSLSFLTSLSGPANPSMNVYLMAPLEDSVFVSSNVTQQRGATNGSLLVQKNPAIGMGPQLGWRAQVGGGAGLREAAGIMLKTDYGSYMLDAGRAPGLSSYALSANGSVELMDGRVFLSGRSYDSFAVAEVPGFPGVPVYVNGQPVAKTNQQGYVVLPNLASYQKSRIRIDTNDLPFEAQMEKTELEVVPHYRSGVSLKFSVTLSTGALVSLVSEQGEPLPNGTQLQIEGNPEVFQVALRGEVYLTGIAGKNRAKAIWNNQSCEIEINLPDHPGPLPHIGPIICKGIQP